MTKEFKLEDICNYAMEKFAGNRDDAETFVIEFLTTAAGWELSKEAGYGSSNEEAKMEMDRMRLNSDLRERSLGRGIVQNLLKGMSVGLGGLLVTGGVAAAGSVMNSAHNSLLHTQFLTALNKAVATSSVLKSANRQKVIEYAETVFKFAPNVATDPNLLSSILANAIHGEGIDPMTVKTLTELENRFSQNTTFNPKNYL